MNEVYPKYYLYKRIVQSKLFIDDHFSEPINLDDIADEAYFSKFHFIRLFKKTYGKTPHQYLTYVRIQKARILLEAGSSVSETCFSVGFDGVNSFSGLFKQYNGCSPLAYQQKMKKRNEAIKAAPLQFIPNCFAEQKGWIKKSNIQEVD